MDTVRTVKKKKKKRDDIKRNQTEINNVVIIKKHNLFISNSRLDNIILRDISANWKT